MRIRNKLSGTGTHDPRDGQNREAVGRLNIGEKLNIFPAYPHSSLVTPGVIVVQRPFFRYIARSFADFGFR